MWTLTHRCTVVLSEATDIDVTWCLSCFFLLLEISHSAECCCTELQKQVGAAPHMKPHSSHGESNRHVSFLSAD